MLRGKAPREARLQGLEDIQTQTVATRALSRARWPRSIEHVSRDFGSPPGGGQSISATGKLRSTC